MGHKINPVGFRIGITKDWNSRWYLDKRMFAKCLLEDYKIRELLNKKLDNAGVKSIEIERSLNQVMVTAKVSKPGVVIGKGGGEVEALREELKKITKVKTTLNVEEVKNVETDAQLVADYISRQIKKRVPYRRVMVAALNSALEKGAKGIKIKLSGLLGGPMSIARSETLKQGPVPSQTIRADIDFAKTDCLMPYGKIGIKVWIYKGIKEI